LIFIAIISFFFILLGVTLAVLCLPSTLIIDSSARRYMATIPLLCKLWLNTDTGAPILHVDFFHISRRIDMAENVLMRLFSKTQSKHPGPKRGRGDLAARVSDVCRLMGKIIGTCRVNQLEICIDAGNYTANALLIPICAMLNQKNIYLSVNFMEQYLVRINIQHRLWLIGLYVLQFYWKTKKRK
jgi:hypothetical protein